MASSLYKKLLTGTAIIGGAAGTIFLTNVFLSKLAKRYDKLPDQENYFNWRYGKVYYTRKGSGAPVLLIHGLYPGASGAAFKELSDSLAERNTVYTLDLPGFGRSDKPQLTYTSYFYVQLMGEFMEKVVQEPASLIVDGSASAFCSIACQLRPSFYTRMILINPTTDMEIKKIPTTGSRMLRKLLELPMIGTLIYNLSVSRLALKHLYGELLSEDLLKQMRAEAHLSDKTARFAFASLATGYMNADSSRSLSRIDRDIYVILSGVPDEAEAKKTYLESINSSIEFEILEGTTDFLWIRHPEKVLASCHMLLN